MRKIYQEKKKRKTYLPFLVSFQTHPFQSISFQSPQESHHASPPTLDGSVSAISRGVACQPGDQKLFYINDSSTTEEIPLYFSVKNHSKNSGLTLVV